MKCPTCQADSTVHATREAPYGVRRRRACTNHACRALWTTVEIPAAMFMQFSNILKALLPLLEAAPTLTAEALDGIKQLIEHPRGSGLRTDIKQAEVP